LFKKSDDEFFCHLNYGFVAATMFVGMTFPFFGGLLAFFGGFAFAPTTYFVSLRLLNAFLQLE